MKKLNIVLWDADTQKDIILKSSKFAVPGAYKLMNNFGKAISYFEKKGVLIMGSVDSHVSYESYPGTRDENLPLHCIKGTTGQLKIKSTQGDILYVSDQKYNQDALDKVIVEIKQGKRVYFEKQTQKCETNPNIEYVFKKLGIKEVYIMGVLTNVCVKYADEYFKKLGIQTYLIKNAIKGKDFPGDTEEEAIKEMIRTGTKFIFYR
ncbi:isochorismatase family protein [Candidatus Woesearchaeota archaeon]|nr:isochorismatase family protein [Candidatus Woesearchaeota archaeon]